MNPTAKSVYVSEVDSMIIVIANNKNAYVIDIIIKSLSFCLFIPKKMIKTIPAKKTMTLHICRTSTPNGIPVIKSADMIEITPINLVFLQFPHT